MQYTMYMDDKGCKMYLLDGLKKSNRITPIIGCYYRRGIYATGKVMHHYFLLDSSSFKFVAEIDGSEFMYYMYAFSYSNRC